MMILNGMLSDLSFASLRFLCDKKRNDGFRRNSRSIDVQRLRKRTRDVILRFSVALGFGCRQSIRIFG